MAYKKQKDIVQDVVKNIGLVSGTSVQTYTQPIIEASIQRMFDMIFRKRYWDWLSGWETFTLDGTNGLINVDIDTKLKAIEDIRKAYISGTDRRIVNPIDREHLHVTGSNPLFWTPLKVSDAQFEKRVLQFWPKTATGSVDIFIRTKPADFGPNDTVPFPSDVIAHATAWDVLDSDGINPTAATKAQTLFDITYQDLVKTLGEEAIGHGGQRSNVPISIRTL